MNVLDIVMFEWMYCIILCARFVIQAVLVILFSAIFLTQANLRWSGPVIIDLPD
jgi:hypothetical protein